MFLPGRGDQVPIFPWRHSVALAERPAEVGSVAEPQSVRNVADRLGQFHVGKCGIGPREPFGQDVGLDTAVSAKCGEQLGPRRAKHRAEVSDLDFSHPEPPLDFLGGASAQRPLGRCTRFG